MEKKWWQYRSLFERNLEKIMPNGRAMILAYDHGVEHGPRDFKYNPKSANPETIIGLAKEGDFTGLVLHGGIAAKYHRMIIDSEAPLILKLNGKSEVYTGDDPYSPLLYGRNVDEAIIYALSLGAKAVGYTVYTGSKYENQMNQEFTQIAREAHNVGLVVIAWMYPRGQSLTAGKSAISKMAIEETMEKAEELGINPKEGLEKFIKENIDAAPSMVAYGARLGMEMGADIVKIKYTGSVETFRWVVENCKPTKVVLSGGLKTKTDEIFLNQVEDVLTAGGAGVAVGRNVWQRENPIGFTKALKEKIFR